MESALRSVCFRIQTHMSRNWEGSFIKQEISGLYFLHLPPHLSFPINPSFCLPLLPLDVPGGFSVSKREEPREGGDLHLTCKANKYLFTALSWQLVNDTEETRSRSPVLSSEVTSGEFSNSLLLLLSNLTARDSGSYRCSAHHLVTGQETHLDTQVEVTSECSVLLVLLLRVYNLIINNLQDRKSYFKEKFNVLLCCKNVMNRNRSSKGLIYIKYSKIMFYNFLDYATTKKNPQ